MKETYEKINNILKEYFFWIPPYNSVNGEWINSFYKNYEDLPKERKEEIKYFVTEDVINPYRRAYQMAYRYKELPIFTKNILEIIECSTIAFFQGNFPCAYISLLPVIETLMYNWDKKELKIPNSYFKKLKNKRNAQNIAKYIAENFKKNIIKGEQDRYKEWLEMLIKYFEYILTNVLYLTINGFKTRYKSKDIFNRNSALHYLENITLFDTEESKIGVIRLFLLIDTIAEIYFLYNYDKYPKLWDSFYLNFNDNLLELYRQFYINCSYYGIMNSPFNTLNNVFLKNNLTEEEIIYFTLYFKIVNKNFDISKKESNKKIVLKMFKETFKKAFLEINNTKKLNSNEKRITKIGICKIYKKFRKFIINNQKEY